MWYVMLGKPFKLKNDDLSLGNRKKVEYLQRLFQKAIWGAGPEDYH